MSDRDGSAREAEAGLLPDREFAPAKINLALHVTGQRADGYHTLDSLVVFAATGDMIEAVPAPGASTPALSIQGPFAAGLAAEDDNLVLRAARALAARGGVNAGFHLSLEKRLPVASGIGGGSADAAATLRLLARLSPRPRQAAMAAAEIAPALGADVPMCLRSTPLRAAGIGERLTPVSGLPRLPMVLVNPRVAVSTPTVFRQLARRDHPPLPNLPAAMTDPAAVAAWLATTRNDLEEPAVRLLPVIAEALSKMAASEGCLLSRMSGSGATVFGLFTDDASARHAAARIKAAKPDWWVTATHAAAA